jgi:hypothetical protein
MDCVTYWNTSFMNIVKSAADSPEQLRPGDVYRVLDEARDLGVEGVFADWLWKQNLMERTRFSLGAATEKRP